MSTSSRKKRTPIIWKHCKMNIRIPIIGNNVCITLQQVANFFRILRWELEERGSSFLAKYATHYLQRKTNSGNVSSFDFEDFFLHLLATSPGTGRRRFTSSPLRSIVPDSFAKLRPTNTCILVYNTINAWYISSREMFNIFVSFQISQFENGHVSSDCPGKLSFSSRSPSRKFV